MTGVVEEKPEKGRFELAVDGQIVFARYSRRGSSLVILHVEAPPALRGTGAAGNLMAGIMETARAEASKVRPLCGYASAWLQRHSQYHDLLG